LSFRVSGAACVVTQLNPETSAKRIVRAHCACSAWEDHRPVYKLGPRPFYSLHVQVKLASVSRRIAQFASCACVSWSVLILLEGVRDQRVYRWLFCRCTSDYRQACAWSSVGTLRWWHFLELDMILRFVLTEIDFSKCISTDIVLRSLDEHSLRPVRRGPPIPDLQGRTTRRAARRLSHVSPDHRERIL
jgi:hypothetical protein